MKGLELLNGVIMFYFTHLSGVHCSLYYWTICFELKLFNLFADIFSACWLLSITSNFLFKEISDEMPIL